jgi:undecaprenyl-diphosphatase
VLTPGDRRGLEWSQAVSTTLLDDAAGAIARLGALSVVAPALGLVAIGLLAWRKVLEGAALIVGLALTVGGVELAQAHVDRPPLPAAPRGTPYPSAPAAYAVAWVAIAVAVRHALPRLSHRAGLIAVAIVTATAIGLTSVYRGTDWFSNVAGGLSLGAACFALSAIAALAIGHLRRRSRRGEQRPRRSSQLSRYDLRPGRAPLSSGVPLTDEPHSTRAPEGSF